MEFLFHGILVKELWPPLGEQKSIRILKKDILDLCQVLKLGKDGNIGFNWVNLEFMHHLVSFNLGSHFCLPSVWHFEIVYIYFWIFQWLEYLVVRTKDVTVLY